MWFCCVHLSWVNDTIQLHWSYSVIIMYSSYSFVLNFVSVNNWLDWMWKKGTAFDLRQTRSNFFVLRETSAKFCLHAGNMKFYSKNEDWISIRVIIRLCLPCDLKIIQILGKLLEYKRSWIQHVNRMSRNILPKVMKHCSQTGRRNYGRHLKRLLVTWDRNGSTSDPTPWQIYDDDDDIYLVFFYILCAKQYK